MAFSTGSWTRMTVNQVGGKSLNAKNEQKLQKIFQGPLYDISIRESYMICIQSQLFIHLSIITWLHHIENANRNAPSSYILILKCSIQYFFGGGIHQICLHCQNFEIGSDFFLKKESLHRRIIPIGKAGVVLMMPNGIRG